MYDDVNGAVIQNSSDPKISPIIPNPTLVTIKGCLRSDIGEANDAVQKYKKKTKNLKSPTFITILLHLLFYEVCLMFVLILTYICF